MSEPMPQASAGNMPAPRGADAVARWEETRLRRRIMHGQHSPDVAGRILSAVGGERAGKWGDPDLTCNLLSASASALSALYATRGTVVADEAQGMAKLELALLESGFWAMMPRVQRDVIGMREHFLRPYINSRGEQRLRRVWADMVEAESTLDDPEQPARLCELRQRVFEGNRIWTWEEMDIRDESKPIWRVWDQERRTDLSKHFLEKKDGSPAPEGGLIGDAYDCRDPNNGDRPLMPYVCYHAERTGQLWDANSWKEVVDGTLSISMMWTFFVHGLKNASWPQRWMAGGKVLSANSAGEVIVDPAVLLRFSSLVDGTPIQVGHFEPGCDPKSLHDAIASYERRVAALAGLNAADVQRVSGDPRSGYALAVTRSGQREAQRRFQPVFEASDAVLLKVISSLNGIKGTGACIRYGAIPKSLDEMRADLEYIERMRAQGLMTQRQAVEHSHPDWTKDEVDRHLADIEKENAAAAA